MVHVYSLRNNREPRAILLLINQNRHDAHGVTHGNEVCRSNPQRSLFARGTLEQTLARDRRRRVTSEEARVVPGA